MFEDDNTQEESTEETQDETEETTTSEGSDTSSDDSQEDDGTDWKAKAIEERNLRKEEEARRKKAEETIEKAKNRAKKPEATVTGLSATDIIALTKANIEAEDIEDVLDYAKYKNVSVVEALKSSVVKATLTEKAELRKSVEAISTGSGRRAGTRITDEQLLADARRGVMPTSDSDLDRLVELRLRRK